jgi:hypothetical protein
MNLRLSPSQYLHSNTSGRQAGAMSLKNGRKTWQRRPCSDARSRVRAEADRDYRKRQHHLIRQSFDLLNGANQRRIDELVVRLFCGIHRQLLLSAVESDGKLFIRRLKEAVWKSDILFALTCFDLHSHSLLKYTTILLLYNY